MNSVVTRISIMRSKFSEANERRTAIEKYESQQQQYRVTAVKKTSAVSAAVFVM